MLQTEHYYLTSPFVYSPIKLNSFRNITIDLLQILQFKFFTAKTFSQEKPFFAAKNEANGYESASSLLAIPVSL